MHSALKVLVLLVVIVSAVDRMGNPEPKADFPPLPPVKWIFFDAARHANENHQQCALSDIQIRNVPESNCRTVYIIRHERSSWNEVEKAGLGGIIKGFGQDFKDSLLGEGAKIVDAVLSDTGIEEGKKLRAALMNNDQFKSLIKTEKIVFAVSNIRRAIQTAALAFGSKSKDALPVFHVLSALQEMTNAPDGISASVPKSDTSPETRFSYQDPKGFYFTLDVTDNRTFKSDDVPPVVQFADFVFRQESNTVIAIGHSLFFQCFFRSLLTDTNHDVARYKLQNGAVASFSLCKSSSFAKTEKKSKLTSYFVKPDSVKFIHKDVETKNSTLVMLTV